MSKKKHKLRTALIITTLIVSAVALSINFVTSRIIKNKINQSENITVQDVTVNVFTMSIRFDEIDLRNLPVDSTHRLNGTVQIANLNHIKLFRYLIHKKIEIGLLEIIDSRASIFLTSDTASNQQSQLNNSKAPQPEGFIDSIVVSQSTLTYERDSNTTVFLSINELLTGKISLPSKTKSVKPKLQSLYLKADSIIYTDSLEMHTFGILGLEADYAGKIIKFDTLRIHPHHDENTFARLSNYQTDRFEGELNQVVLNLYAPESLISLTALKGGITCKDFDLTIYRDKNIPRKPHDIKKTVQQYLHAINFELDIDTFAINNGKIIYREKAIDSKLSGEILFDSISGALSGINNTNPEAILRLKAKSLFMKSAHLQIELEFPYSTNYFNCSGQIRGLPFPHLNPISSPVAGVLFTRGAITKLAFNMRADIDSSRGDLILEYHNLDFAKQDKSSGDTTGIKSRIIAYIGGEIIVPSSIPEKVEATKPGLINSPRNPERFIFNYIWKSIYSGILSVVKDSAPKDKETKSSKRKKHKKDKRN